LEQASVILLFLLPLFCSFIAMHSVLSTKRSQRAPLPSELLHKILRTVLAESIHAICVLPVITQWDMTVVWTLAQTCFTWKEVVKRMLTLAFAIGGEFGEEQVDYSDSEFFHLVNKKLMQLRTLGERSREPFNNNISLHPFNIQDSCPLSQSYSLYLTSTALRRHADQDGELNMVIHASIISALNVALKVSERIKPAGIAVVLQNALLTEILVVEFGTMLANARVDLEDCLSKISSSLTIDTERDVELHRDRIKMEMDKHFDAVERVVCPSCNDIDTSEVEIRQILGLSKIAGTLNKYRSLEIDMDVYDIKGRASALVEQWCLPAESSE